MIDFEHVTKIYKRSDTPALEDIDFHVDDGEFVFLVGHSGAGKSTLLKLILREELPTEGRVMVDGKDVARLRRGKVPFLRRQMGIIFQDFRPFPRHGRVAGQCAGFGAWRHSNAIAGGLHARRYYELPHKHKDGTFKGF